MEMARRGEARRKTDRHLNISTPPCRHETNDNVSNLTPKPYHDLQRVAGTPLL